MLIKIESDLPVAIVMVGLPGSGKSTIAQQIEIDRNQIIEKPIVHSSDALRKELFGDEKNNEHNNDIFSELHKRIKRDLKDGKSIVFDATNIDKKRRISFLRDIERYNCQKVCICTMAPFMTCVERNEARERVVPYHSMTKMYKNWSPPHTSEGFDNIILSYTDTRHRSNPHAIQDLFEKLDQIDQENRHHDLTIGEHCRSAASYIKENTNDKCLLIATLLHDIGKPFTKTRDDNGECHYYQHQCVGAYDSFFHTDALDFTPEEQSYIANLIYYHMDPINKWQYSEKARQRDFNLIGEKMVTDILSLHEADVKASRQEIDRDYEEREGFSFTHE